MGRLERLSLQLEQFPKIGLDTVIFIYAFERHPDFGPLAQTVFQTVEKKTCQACASVLALGEVLVGVKRAGDYDLQLRYQSAFQYFPNLALCDADFRVMDIMSDLRLKYNLHTPDAIHLATALSQQAQAFITNDLRLKKVTELEIVVLTEFM